MLGNTRRWKRMLHLCLTDKSAHTVLLVHTHTRTDTCADATYGSFTPSLTKHWRTINKQCGLMWRPCCMWCVSMNRCVPFFLWWMCNEVAEASIQQFSIYELLTLERRDLNVTPSWNNFPSFTSSSAPFSTVLPAASHAKQMVRAESQEASNTAAFAKHVYAFVLCLFHRCGCNFYPYKHNEKERTTSNQMIRVTKLLFKLIFFYLQIKKWFLDETKSWG